MGINFIFCLGIGISLITAGEKASWAHIERFSYFYMSCARKMGAIKTSFSYSQLSMPYVCDFVCVQTSKPFFFFMETSGSGQLFHKRALFMCHYIFIHLKKASNSSGTKLVPLGVIPFHSSQLREVCTRTDPDLASLEIFLSK